MARKGQVQIQDVLETNEAFEAFLETNFNKLICMEVYSEFCGYCLATGNAIRKGKLEIGGDQIAMARAAADHIEALSRFKEKSEPVFLFIFKGKLTRAMFGANGIELARIMEEEMAFMLKEVSTGVARPKQEITTLLPEEARKIHEDLRIEEEIREAAERMRTLTVAARKRRIAERTSWYLKRLNYIMFWPHCHQAYYDLYEKWDMINIQVVAKEMFEVTEEGIKESLYMSDVKPNEACVHALMSGEALVVLFKISDTDDRDFVELLRYTLYEEIPIPKEDVPPEKQIPLIPAYERYATISKTAREVRRDRYNERQEKLRLEKEERDRLAAEEARLAREAREEEERIEKQRQEEERMARIQAGLPAEPEVDPDAEEVEGGAAPLKAEEPVPVQQEPEEKEEEFHSDVSIDGEDYIPPGGQFVPGFYSPLNDLSKSTGLTYFFPKVVSEMAVIQSEYLPPHALVMFPVEKRYEVQELIEAFSDEIFNYGIFVGDDPYTAEHLAYTIKQYDKMDRKKKNKDRIAVQVSRKRSLPLLQLAGVNPCYISPDEIAGEKECLVLFPVGYGDNYEEEESIKEDSPNDDIPKEESFKEESLKETESQANIPPDQDEEEDE